MIDTAADAVFAIGAAIAGPAPSEDEISAWWAAQRRRELARYVLAVVVVCAGIVAASALHLG